MSDLVNTHLRQARGFQRIGDSRRAVELLERARALARNNPADMQVVLEELSVAYAGAGMHEKAAVCRSQLAKSGGRSDGGGWAVAQAEPVAPVRTMRSPVRRRNPLLMAGAGVVMAVICIGGGAFWWQHHGRGNAGTAVAAIAPEAGPSTSFVAPAANLSGPAPVANPAAPPLGWAATFAKIDSSVYQIQGYVRDKRGHEHCLETGTGWSVQKGWLATNAHVAKIFDDVGPTGYVIARSGPKINDLRVTRCRVHQGRDDFARLWDKYTPFNPLQLKFEELSLLPCDVALLEIDPEDVPKQGLPIPLAADETDRGIPVGYIGYPTEGVKNNLDLPASYQGTGEITGFLGVLAESAKRGNETYMRHSLATLGGSSGSPIFNSTGQVVAINFAGDVQGEDANGNRRAVPGFKYAIPVDIVRELVNRTDGTLQKQRHAVWEATLLAEFNRGVANPGILKNFLASAELSDLQDADKTYENWKMVSITEGDALVNHGSKTEQIMIPEGGKFCVCVCGDQPGDGLEADVVSNSKTFPVNRDVKSGQRRYCGISPPLTASNPMTIELRLASSRPTKVSWGLFQLVQP